MHFINKIFLLKIIISIIYKINLRISVFFLTFRLCLDHVLQEQYLINLNIYNIILLYYYIFLSK